MTTIHHLRYLTPAPLLTAVAAAIMLAPVATATGTSAAAPLLVQTPPLPEGYQWVTDETETIGMAIPAGWTFTSSQGIDNKTTNLSLVATRPDDDGELIINATPYSGPVTAWDPASCDPMQQECSAVIDTASYDDGSFVGERQTLEGCCASGFFDNVDVTAKDSSLTLSVSYWFGDSRDADEVAVLDTMLGTLTRVGEPLPAIPPIDQPVFPYADFSAVPQLGTEPVRGSGCGANGQIGDVIPDGLWAGFVAVDDGSVGVDLLCVFTDIAAIDEQAANVLSSFPPDYVIVNNNERVRTVPAAPDLALRDARQTTAGYCAEGSFLPDVDHSPYQAWITIEGGAATTIVWGCQALDAAAKAPTEAPTAGSAPSATVG